MDLSEEKHHFELTQNIQLHKILASNGFCQVQLKKKQKKRQYWGWNKVRSYFFHNAKMDVDRISTTLHCIGATSWKWKRSALAGIDGFRSQLIHSSAPERYPIDIPYQGQYWAFRRKTPAGFPDRSFHLSCLRRLERRISTVHLELEPWALPICFLGLFFPDLSRVFFVCVGF